MKTRLIKIVDNVMGVIHGDDTWNERKTVIAGMMLLVIIGALIVTILRFA